MSLTAEQAAALVERLQIDGGKLHQVVHGGASTTVPTEGGDVPSLAKFFADNGLELEGKQDASELLAAIASIAGAAADKLIYLTGDNTAATTGFTAAARTLLACTNAVTMLAALGAVAKDGTVAMTGPLKLSGNPSNALHAVPQQYVDNLVAGLKIKPSCRLATTTNDTLAGLAARDGITPVAGNRIFVAQQSAASANGIYVAASGAWSRAEDFNAWAEMPGALVLVEEGTAYADTGWVCTSNVGGTIGTTSIVWSKFFGTGLFQVASANLSTLAALSSVANLGTLAGLSSIASLTAIAALETGAYGRSLLTVTDALAARVAIGIKNPTYSQSNAPISMRGILGNQIEFGHTNLAGFGCNFGCFTGNGGPYLVFFGEEGTNQNTYRTRGIQSIAFRGRRDLSPVALDFETVSNASADNQAPINIARLSANGNFSITGTLSKAAGTFVVFDPLGRPGHKLRHGFVEAPRYDLIYRGTVRLVAGRASVDIDAASNMTSGVFAALTKNAVVASLQNQDAFALVKPQSLDGGTFEIVCEDDACTDLISWVVIAERNDAYVRLHDANCVDGVFVPEFLEEAPPREES